MKNQGKNFLLLRHLYYFFHIQIFLREKNYSARDYICKMPYVIKTSENKLSIAATTMNLSDQKE